MTKTMAKTAFTVGLLILFMAIPAFAASINKSVKIAADSTADGATSVNGSISVGENAVVTDSVSTVNGSIRVSAGAAIEDASTVNGGVNVADNVQSEDLNTVNGTIKIGKSVTVDGEVGAVNGRIVIAPGSRVARDVSNVNGHIELLNAEVGGDVTTVTGDVDVLDQSTVRGNLVVEKPSQWGNNRRRKPRIIVGPGSTVIGMIDLRHEVELYISDAAVIGGVSGVMNIDQAVRFSGERP